MAASTNTLRQTDGSSCSNSSNDSKTYVRCRLLAPHEERTNEFKPVMPNKTLLYASGGRTMRGAFNRLERPEDCVVLLLL